MPNPDPLDALKDQWQTMLAPPAVRALEDEDAVTKAAVAWMAKGWSQIEIPPASLPRRPRVLRFRNTSLAIAAALLIGFAVLWTTQQTLQEEVDAPRLVVSAPAPLPEASQDSIATGGQPSLPPAKAPSPILIANTQDQVQVLSGKVRLTMLRDPGISPDSKPTDF